MSKRMVDQDIFYARLPPLDANKSTLMRRLEQSEEGERMLIAKERRVGALHEAGLAKAHCVEISWREMQVCAWLEGLISWPIESAMTTQIRDIQMGFADPLPPLEQDIAEHKRAVEAQAEEERRIKLAGKTGVSLTEALTGGQQNVDLITSQLLEGQGRTASYTQVVNWVADNIDNPTAMPVDAPSNAAYSMLLSAREDRKAFYTGLRQTMKESDKDVRDSLDDPRYQDIEGLLEKFSSYQKFEADLQLLQELVPFARQVTGGVVKGVDETTRALFSRVIEVGAA